MSVRTTLLEGAPTDAAAFLALLFIFEAPASAAAVAAAFAGS
jgi:hypothetical protein